MFIVPSMMVSHCASQIASLQIHIKDKWVENEKNVQPGIKITDMRGIAFRPFTLMCL